MPASRTSYKPVLTAKHVADKPLLLRHLPASLRNRLECYATADFRSLNGEILHILERYAAQRRKREEQQP